MQVFSNVSPTRRALGFCEVGAAKVHIQVNKEKVLSIIIRICKGANYLFALAWDSLCPFVIQLYVVRGGLLPVILSVQSLLNLFHNVVADIFLRFSVLKDVAASVKANTRDALHIIV